MKTTLLSACMAVIVLVAWGCGPTDRPFAGDGASTVFTQQALSIITQQPPSIQKKAHPSVGLPGDKEAIEDWTRLRANAERFTELRFDDGVPVFMSVDVKAPGTDPVARALGFIEEYRRLFGLSDPRTSLFPTRIIEDETGTHVFLGQRKGDLQVFGAELAVHLEGDRVTGTNGRYVPEPWSSGEPTLDASQAESAALQSTIVLKARTIGHATLGYFSTVIGGTPPLEKTPCLGDCGPATRAAWRVTLAGVFPNGGGTVVSLFVDAVSGKILARDEHDLADDFTLDLRTFHADPEDWSLARCTHGPAVAPSDDFEAAVAERSAAIITQYFDRHFEIHSWDRSGRMDLLLHFSGIFDTKAVYRPACNNITFRDGYTVTDVFAHEFTHGVHNRIGGGAGSDPETRAIAEHVADVFGALVEGNWLLGESTPDGVRRNMQDPAALGHPDHYSDIEVFDPDVEFSDARVVHVNAGIGDKAAYLIAEGGTHRGVTVAEGLGREKLAYLYYPVITARLPYTALYPDLRDAAVEEARALVRAGLHGFVRGDVCTVNDAFAAVGLGRPCSEPGVDDDHDDVPDDIDTCLRMSDPLQRDLDGDHLGDLCDLDMDGDGVEEDGDHSGRIADHRCRTGETTNCDDNCPRVANGDQRDSDADGQGDACDDRDFDGIGDTRDNCPDVPNPDQANFDRDGFDGDPNHGGDACDHDADGDGISDRDFSARCVGGSSTGCNDNCVLLWDPLRTINPTQDDSDMDGVGDLCDNCEGVATLDIQDADHDGVGNVCDPDADNDGVCNVTETPPPGTPGLPFGGCIPSGPRPGGLDNCPLVPNPEQFDFDHDGVGTLCDFDEDSLLSGEFSAQFLGPLLGRVLREGLLIPIEPCPNDECPRYPSPSSLIRLNAATDPPLPLEVSVLDSMGFRIGGPTSGKLELAPRASAFFRSKPQAKPFRGERYWMHVRAESPEQKLPDNVKLGFQIQIDSGGPPPEPDPDKD